MREYRQLTKEDRIEIYAMKQAGKEQKMIAAELDNPTQNQPTTVEALRSFASIY